MSSLSSSTPLPQPPASNPRLRAARVLLFLGALEIVLFGLTTFAITRAARMSVDDLTQLTGANLSLEQLQSIHPHLKSFAIALACTGIVPGAVYVLCSIGLRRASTGGAAACLVATTIAVMQFFVLGAILLRQLLVAFAYGDPPAITLNVLAFGTPMAFLVFVIRCLFQVKSKR